MQEHYPFIRDDVLPSFWANAIQRFVSTHAQIVLSQATETSLQIVASADEGAAVIAIDGKWRWNEATVTRAHPGGAAGVFDVFVTAADNDVDNVPDVFTDHTDPSFALAIVAETTTPPINPGVVDIFRQIGKCLWDGARITEFISILPGSSGEEPIGALLPYAGAGDPLDPRYLLADGRLVVKASYPAAFGRWGHAYNGGVDPGGGMFRLPDKRGRGSLGADQMLGTRRVGADPGAAGRLTVAGGHQNARGQNGGAEGQVLSIGNLPLLQVVGARVGVDGASANWNLALQQLERSWGVGPGGGDGSASPIAGVGLATPSGAAHNNVHPYEVDNWIVKVA